MRKLTATVEINRAPATSPTAEAPLIDVRSLRVSFRDSGRQPLDAVEDVSLAIGRGERVAVVGESGSGKSLTALSMIGLVGRTGGVVGHESVIQFNGQDLAHAPESTWKRVRGRQIAMVFQDPFVALNPVYTIGHQLVEATKRVSNTRAAAISRAETLLADVRLPDPPTLMHAYPHELSGGMRQRVVIAIALAGDPSLLLADEPTTALDVSTQQEIMDLLYEISTAKQLAVLLITHNLGLAAGFTDRCYVLYGGRVVEHSSMDDIVHRPTHPYTIGLLRSLPGAESGGARLLSIPGSPPDLAMRPSGCTFHPRCPGADDRCRAEVPLITALGFGSRAATWCACHHVESFGGYEKPVAITVARREAASAAPPAISVESLWKSFGRRRGVFGGHVVTHAVRDASLEIHVGEAFGLVGESGSGKSTLARCVMHLATPTSGRVRFFGEDLATLSTSDVRDRRRKFQMIFQDPGSSLDPRMTVREILAEPLQIHGLRRRRTSDDAPLLEVLDLVQLGKGSLDRYPHEFSGGQRQRLSLARALTLRPDLLVLDEPVSALDVSVQASVLNLLADLRRELGLAMLFISHDLSLVRYLCTRVAVMNHGQIVESCAVDELFEHSTNPYVQTLLAAQPLLEPQAERERRAVRVRRAAVSRVAEAS